MLPDAALVRMAKRGESDAYAELVRRWSVAITVTCRARVHCLNTAEDLTQETLLRGWDALATLQDDNKFGSWLRAIAHRVCLDWLKKHQNRQVPFSTLGQDNKGGDAFAGTSTDPLENLARQSEYDQLHIALESLPEEEREIMLLYATGDWTYAALSEHLEIAVGTVNVRLARARTKLCKLLSAQGEITS